MPKLDFTNRALAGAAAALALPNTAMSQDAPAAAPVIEEIAIRPVYRPPASGWLNGIGWSMSKRAKDVVGERASDRVAVSLAHAWLPLLVAGVLLAAGCSKAPAPAKVDESPAKAAAEEPTEEAAPVAAVLKEAPGGGIIVQKNVMIPMRDGVRLATDIYRPAGGEKYPVVLVRTPYGNESPLYGDQALFYVKKGYAYAIQDCRGKYDSEGDWYGKRDEAQDGSDTITWLGTRSWSSGKVGMTGGSYLGMVQYLVADQENPYLKALVPMVAPTTLGRDTTDFDHLAVYSGREAISNITWMMSTDGRVNQNDGNFSLTFERAWDYLPRSEYPKVFGKPMKWWSFMQTNRNGFWEEYYLRAAHGEWQKPFPELDSWWQNYEERYKKVNVPMLHISGWYDCCGEPPTKMFQLVRKYASDPVVKNNQQLVMGPWPHGVGKSKNGDVEFGPQAKMDPDEASVQWFDRWLKGQENGIDKRKPVRLFVMGENRWREADDWPVPGTQFTKYYFSSKGAAQLSKGGGQLSTEEPTGAPADRFTYDPADVRPLPGTALFGPVDLAANQKRDDVLVYTTPPLDKPVEVTGPLSAVVYVSSSAPSMDIMVRLFDVHPNGTAYSMYYVYADPFRTPWSKSVETAADGTRITKAEIALPPTSVLFQKGHRIRVEISSAYFVDGGNIGLAKRFGAHGLNVEPGTEATATKWNIAQQAVYHDKARASHIVLPVIPR